MALEIRKAEAAPVGVIADRRLYLNADKSRIVEDGDPTAAFLLATPGTTIPAADVAALGLEVVDGKVQHRSASATDDTPPPKADDTKKAAEPKGKR
jgi:hypothetical protein